MMGYVLRAATPQDALRIAPLLRDKDKLEAEVVAGTTPEAALLASLAAPGEVLFAETADDHRPILICGVAPTHPKAAAIWMLGTPLIEQYAIPSVRESMRWISGWHENYPLLWNRALEANDLHLRWLELLGFSFLRRVFIRGVPFIEFAKLKDNSSCVIQPPAWPSLAQA